jgi:hypothetical protein
VEMLPVQGSHNLFAASLQIIVTGHSRDAGGGVLD